MNRILNVCVALCLTVIPVEAVKADITAPIVYLEHVTPSVSLNINGKEVNRLSIDTGASGAFYLPRTVFDSIFTELNHRTTTVQNSIDVFGVEKSAVTARASNITVNGERLSDVNVEIFKTWGNGGMLDDNGQLIINGVLGLGVAKNKTLIINYASKVLTIADHLKALPDGYRWQSIPFTRTRNGIEISVSSGNEKIRRMVIDTGASHTMLFTRSKEGCAKLSQHCPKKAIVTPDGVKLSAFIFQIPDERIDFDGLLGDDFLSNRVLIISNDRLLISLPNNS
ncbi:aspartyl protease family protein [Xenorhabdus bovienii]|uniref:Aspartyl protease family protein n=1 Tax=Xenorhabdus bovienii TaxID=40576 RepID=A0AAJ1J6V1_XENBV|nr:aspartyl protease family protein [Xenorhabdus bovienii]MDE1478204.1 aspartyl protease family protein [Xenorhabdus bovienii]MDE1488167.1 aspartyl protease family protein [Xenorhabdus bovienii]MDE1496239.1 aspartyl protease family protein [Xenorhabdus bovienii]MDE9433784.1 aspartyl protease family protein [Xenorhabdus bovienii]MDE9459265.1 aspartyl protease family protein [Xenorhabdus bovienii]